MSTNAEFLARVTPQARESILASIAARYGITVAQANAEVCADGAHDLLDYLVEPQRSATAVLMQRHGVRG